MILNQCTNIGMASWKGFEPLTPGLGIGVKSADPVPVIANCWFANILLHDIIANRKRIMSDPVSVSHTVFGEN